MKEREKAREREKGRKREKERGITSFFFGNFLPEEISFSPLLEVVGG